jgi:hypothetical protein
MSARFPLNVLCEMVLVFAAAPQPINDTAPPLLALLFTNCDFVMVKLEPDVA